MKFSHYLMSGVALAVMPVSAAYAQDAASDAAAAAAAAQAATDEGYGDEIVVTATRREQSAQDVPLAVSVVGGEQLKIAGVTDIRGLKQLSPSLQATTGQSAATGAVLSIRGIGTAGDNPGFEPAVGVFIDGVFRARAGVALSELPPIERVEVLRGPQGTLFGRNTSAGALSITTAMPKFTLGGYGEVAYGNYDNIEVKAGVTGPVSENLALRVDGGFHKRDGYIKDANSDRRINDLDRYFVRAQGLYETENLTFRLIGDYSKTDENCCGALNSNSGFELYPTIDQSTSSAVGYIASNVIQGLAAAQGNVGIVRPYDPKGRTMAISPNRDYKEAVKDWGVSGQFDVDLGDMKLTSITAWRDWKATRDQDVDFSGADRAYRDDYKTSMRDFSQELRLQGKAFDDKLDWLVGGFYLNEKLKLRDTVRFGTQADAYADLVTMGASRSAALPNGFQWHGTQAGVPTFGQVALVTLNTQYLGLNTDGTPIVNPSYDPAAYAAIVSNPALLASVVAPLPSNVGAGQNNDNYTVNTQALALFTHNIINFNDNISLTLGLRYNHEKKKLKADLNVTNPGCSALLGNQVLAAALQAQTPSAAGARALSLLVCNPTVNPMANGDYKTDRSDNEFTGTAKLAIKLNDEVMVYGGYDRGFKSGGFNLDRATFSYPIYTPGVTAVDIDDLAFGPETVNSFEIGVKTNFSREFTFNATAFRQDFHNYQSLDFMGNNFVVQSYDKVRSQGIELESIIRPIRQFTVNLAYTYLDAKVKDVAAGDDNGKQVTNQPKHVVTGGVTWTPDLTENVGLLANVNFRTQSDSTPDNNPLALAYVGNDGYTIINAKVGLNFGADRQYGIEAYVENLTNQYYNVTAFPIPEQGNSFAGYPAPPRFYGVRVRASF